MAVVEAPGLVLFFEATANCLHTVSGNRNLGRYCLRRAFFFARYRGCNKCTVAAFLREGGQCTRRMLSSGDSRHNSTHGGRRHTDDRGSLVGIVLDAGNAVRMESYSTKWHDVGLGAHRPLDGIGLSEQIHGAL